MKRVHGDSLSLLSTEEKTNANDTVSGLHELNGKERKKIHQEKVGDTYSCCFGKRRVRTRETIRLRVGALRDERKRETPKIRETDFSSTRKRLSLTVIWLQKDFSRQLILLFPFTRNMTGKEVTRKGRQHIKSSGTREKITVRWVRSNPKLSNRKSNLVCWPLTSVPH